MSDASALDQLVTAIATGGGTGAVIGLIVWIQQRDIMRVLLSINRRLGKLVGELSDDEDADSVRPRPRVRRHAPPHGVPIVDTEGDPDHVTAHR